jgi:DNA invertase Pin-like site-specific DNA recombinase
VKVALYARFSSDLQRASSIADQFRVCREYAKAQGWEVAAEFSDAGISGASLNRPGLQNMMRAVRSKTIDAVLAEALDRFSRSQEGTAHLFSRLKYERVRMFTKSEGEIGPLHVPSWATRSGVACK